MDPWTNNHSELRKHSRMKRRSLDTKNRLARLAWIFVWTVFGRLTPRPLHAWRCFLLRLFGAQIGRCVHPYPSAKVWAPWNLRMGDHSCLAEGTICYNVDLVCIGPNVTISQFSHLCTASHDYTDSTMPLVSAPIIVEKDAWITTDVFVGPGVTIGEGAVVTARSSVFSDIPPWVVARGNPAKPFRERTISR